MAGVSSMGGRAADRSDRPIRRRPSALRYSQLPPMVSNPPTLPASRPRPIVVAPESASHRTCRTCGLTLPIEQFPLWTVRRRSASGPTERLVYTASCRECERRRQRRLRERRALARGRVIRPRTRTRPGYHRCPRCEQLLPRAAFGNERRRWVRRDGTVREALRRRWLCIPCFRIRRREDELRRSLRMARDPALARRRQQQSLAARKRQTERRRQQRTDQVRWISTVVQRLTRRAAEEGWLHCNLVAVSGVSRITLKRYDDRAYVRRLMQTIERAPYFRTGARTHEPKLVDLLQRLETGDPDTMAILSSRRCIHGDPLQLRDRFRTPEARRLAAVRDRGV